MTMIRRPAAAGLHRSRAAVQPQPRRAPRPWRSFTKRRRPRSRWCSMPADRPRRMRRASSSSRRNSRASRSRWRAASAMCSTSSIEQQLAAGKLEVDFAFFQTVQDFVNWKKRDKLLAFKPDGFDQIMPNLRDPDGAYMAFAAVAIAYAYNTKLVRAEDVPKSALDFLKPAFQGKLISVYPHDDDAALYLFHLIVQKYGWNWMDRYMANKPHFIQGHLPVARAHRRRQDGRHARRDDHHGRRAQTRRARRSRSCSRRGRDAGVHASPAASSRTRRIRTPPSCSSPGTWRRSSSRGSAPSRRGSTCRRPQASSR